MEPGFAASFTDPEFDSDIILAVHSMLSLLAAKETPFQGFLYVSPSFHHALSTIALSPCATDIKTENKLAIYQVTQEVLLS